MSCVFCGRIQAGEYDECDEHAVSFVPLNPVVEGGHVLIVPRMHVRNALEVPVITGRVAEFAAELGRSLGWQCNLITSTGRDATQSVMHLHWHLVRRVAGDGLLLPWTDQLTRSESYP